MDLEALGTFIQTVGFPVVVALFVLWRLNGKMEVLASALRGLTPEVKHLVHSLEELDNTAEERLLTIEREIRDLKELIREAGRRTG